MSSEPVAGDGAGRTSVEQEAPVAVVTGAARGIGAAVTRQLTGQGWYVVATDRCADDPVLDYALAAPGDLTRTVEACQGRAMAWTADVRDQKGLDAAVAAARREFGRLDAAVAAAGVVAGGEPLWELDDTSWDVLFDVNVGGVRRLAAASVPAMLEAAGAVRGRFVGVASAAGVLGLPRMAAYSSAKHAVVGLVKGLAADLGGTGVTANAVCPGSTRTAVLDASAAVYGLASAEQFGRQQLVERLLEPDEPAALITWLCGAAASGVTGAALAVDGGMTAS